MKENLPMFSFFPWNLFCYSFNRSGANSPWENGYVVKVTFQWLRDFSNCKWKESFAVTSHLALRPNGEATNFSKFWGLFFPDPSTNQKLSTHE